MININGKKYAKNDSEFTSTLFDNDGTASGYYKKRSNGVLLMDIQKRPFAFVVVNKYGDEPFLVSCSQTEEGIRYMFGLSSLDEKMLSMPHPCDYRGTGRVAYQIAKDAGIGVERFKYLEQTA